MTDGIYQPGSRAHGVQRESERTLAAGRGNVPEGRSIQRDVGVEFKGVSWS